MATTLKIKTSYYHLDKKFENPDEGKGITIKFFCPTNNSQIKEFDKYKEYMFTVELRHPDSVSREDLLVYLN
jgi:hypothetical protein